MKYLVKTSTKELGTVEIEKNAKAIELRHKLAEIAENEKLESWESIEVFPIRENGKLGIGRAYRVDRLY